MVQGWGIAGSAGRWTLAGCGAALLLAIALLAGSGLRAEGAGLADGTHLGVGSCARSTCHGRQEPTGAVVRQDEIQRWQDESSPAGAHSRAWRVLGGARGRSIAARLGIGDPQASPQCLGCHADPGATRGPMLQRSDGVTCEACHGGASTWLASHYAVGTSHARNVAQGMVALDDPRVRAGVCLDCHFGSAAPGQFVDHRLMAAGHPRIAFELDLFTTMEQHWNEDSDYAARKGRPSNVKVWAVGQAEAVARSLSLYAQPDLGTTGAFPEFYFFDCQTCHRRISDDPDYRPSAPVNPGRPVPLGFPAYQDENMIMLSAAAAVAAPDAGRQFDAASRAFHAALAQGRPQSLAAGAKLRASALALSARLSGAALGPGETLAILDRIASGAISDRFTDYEGCVQAVMGVDTLLSALVNQGAVSRDAAAGIRVDINRAYAAVRDPNTFDPAGFQRALGGAAASIRRLR